MFFCNSKMVCFLLFNPVHLNQRQMTVSKLTELLFTVLYIVLIFKNTKIFAFVALCSGVILTYLLGKFFHLPLAPFKISKMILSVL